MVGEAVRGLARIDIVGTSAGTSASATASILVGGDDRARVANSDVGDQGATALAAALLESGAVCQVLCCLNHIGLAGQSALLQVLEAKHSASLGGYVSVAFAQAPALFPPFLQRAFACGVRYNWETRGLNYYL